MNEVEVGEAPLEDFWDNATEKAHKEVFETGEATEEDREKLNKIHKYRKLNNERGIWDKPNLTNGEPGTLKIQPPPDITPGEINEDLSKVEAKRLNDLVHTYFEKTEKYLQQEYKTFRENNPFTPTDVDEIRQITDRDTTIVFGYRPQKHEILIDADPDEATDLLEQANIELEKRYIEQEDNFTKIGLEETSGIYITGPHGGILTEIIDPVTSEEEELDILDDIEKPENEQDILDDIEEPDQDDLDDLEKSTQKEEGEDMPKTKKKDEEELGEDESVLSVISDEEGWIEINKPQSDDPSNSIGSYRGKSINVSAQNVPEKLEEQKKYRVGPYYVYVQENDGKREVRVETDEVRELYDEDKEYQTKILKIASGNYKSTIPIPIVRELDLEGWQKMALFLRVEEGGKNPKYSVYFEEVGDVFKIDVFEDKELKVSPILRKKNITIDIELSGKNRKNGVAKINIPPEVSTDRSNISVNGEMYRIHEDFLKYTPHPDQDTIEVEIPGYGMEPMEFDIKHWENGAHIKKHQKIFEPSFKWRIGNYYGNKGYLADTQKGYMFRWGEDIRYRKEVNTFEKRDYVDIDGKLPAVGLQEQEYDELLDALEKRKEYGIASNIRSIVANVDDGEINQATIIFPRKIVKMLGIHNEDTPTLTWEIEDGTIKTVFEGCEEVKKTGDSIEMELKEYEKGRKILELPEKITEHPEYEGYFSFEVGHDADNDMVLIMNFEDDIEESELEIDDQDSEESEADRDEEGGMRVKEGPDIYKSRSLGTKRERLTIPKQLVDVFLKDSKGVEIHQDGDRFILTPT